MTDLKHEPVAFSLRDVGGRARLVVVLLRLWTAEPLATSAYAAQHVLGALGATVWSRTPPSPSWACSCSSSALIGAG